MEQPATPPRSGGGGDDDEPVTDAGDHRAAAHAEPQPEESPCDAGETGRVACVWCASANVELLSSFGPGLMTEQWFCRDCGSPFERVIKRGR